MQTDVRFHDYDATYAHHGLYEQLFYDRLKCQSPEKVVTILRHAMADEPRLFNELRVIDLGAGNGLVGQELQKFGVARLVGVDISAQAAMAVGRDRHAPRRERLHAVVRETDRLGCGLGVLVRPPGPDHAGPARGPLASASTACWSRRR